MIELSRDHIVHNETRSAIYARVSIPKKGKAQYQMGDPENQLRELREYCKRRNWKITKEYVDRMTGDSKDRPEFQQLLEDARQRKLDIIVVWSLDRFTREGSLATHLYLERLNSYGVGFVSYTEQYLDTIGPFKDAVLGILATLAKIERQKIKERISAGIQKRIAEGKEWGRRSRVYDLDYMRELRAKGYGYVRISKEYKKKFGVEVSHQTIKRRLDSDKAEEEEPSDYITLE